MRPTEVLKSEHRVIETVLDCLEKLANQTADSKAVDANSAREILDFLATFADRCHHGKEEELLFKALERKGFSPDAGPTSVMRSEHEIGRMLMEVMRLFVDGVDSASRQRFVEAAREYVDLLRQHIRKEDHCLFTMADQMLSADEQAALSANFDSFEHGPEMAGAHERCLNSARELASRFGFQSGMGSISMTGYCGHYKPLSAVAT